jgi:hypothetical protein
MTDETQSLLPPDPIVSGTFWLESGGSLIGGDWIPADSCWQIEGRSYHPVMAWRLGYRFAHHPYAAAPNGHHVSVWTIYKPGALVHRNGMHRVRFDRVSAGDRPFHTEFFSAGDWHWMSAYETPAAAKGAAEQHAA